MPLTPPSNLVVSLRSLPVGAGIKWQFTKLSEHLPLSVPYLVPDRSDALDPYHFTSAKLSRAYVSRKTNRCHRVSVDRCEITAGYVQAERRPGNRVTGGRVVKRLAGDWAKLPGPDEGEARTKSIRLAPKDRIEQLSASLFKKRERLRFHQRIVDL